MSIHKTKWQVAFAVWFAAAFMALTARAEEPNAIHVIENSIKMKLVYLPPGDFDMGSPKSELGRWKGRFGEMLAKDGIGESIVKEEKLHRVRLTSGFYLGAHEVTQAQFQQILGRNPARFSKNGVAKADVSGKDTSSYPVESITWYDAVEFCNALSKSEELPEFYTLREVEREDGSIVNADVTENGGDGYRLPTVAEWEYACRAGSDTSYCCGNDFNELRPYAWFYYNSPPTTQPVGTKRPNAWGLFDMHGNVWEWCNDWYAEYDGDAIDPHGADSGEKRELRGGSYYIPHAARSKTSADS